MRTMEDSRASVSWVEYEAQTRIARIGSARNPPSRETFIEQPARLRRSEERNRPFWPDPSQHAHPVEDSRHEVIFSLV
jgi:hypothetical protein